MEDSAVPELRRDGFAASPGKKKVCRIIDGHPLHRSKPVSAWLEKGSARSVELDLRDTVRNSTRTRSLT